MVQVITTIGFKPSEYELAQKLKIPIGKICRDALSNEISKRTGINKTSNVEELKRLAELQAQKSKEASEQYVKLIDEAEKVEVNYSSFESDRNTLIELLRFSKEGNIEKAKDFCRDTCGKYGLSPREFWEKATGETL